MVGERGLAAHPVADRHHREAAPPRLAVVGVRARRARWCPGSRRARWRTRRTSGRCRSAGPGPMRLSHQPGVGCPGASGPAAWLSPVRAWHTSTALRRVVVERAPRLVGDGDVAQHAAALEREGAVAEATGTGGRRAGRPPARRRWPGAATGGRAGGRRAARTRPPCLPSAPRPSVLLLRERTPSVGSRPEHFVALSPGPHPHPERWESTLGVRPRLLDPADRATPDVGETLPSRRRRTPDRSRPLDPPRPDLGPDVVGDAPSRRRSRRGRRPGTRRCPVAHAAVVDGQRHRRGAAAR